MLCFEHSDAYRLAPKLGEKCGLEPSLFSSTQAETRACVSAMCGTQSGHTGIDYERNSWRFEASSIAITNLSLGKENLFQGSIQVVGTTVTAIAILVLENDASVKAQNKAHERDELKFLQGPIIRLKAKQIQARLSETIQCFVTKALDVYTIEKENQDSISCFQENQETESWSNFTVLDNFKNQENQDFKS
ncbi:hypothetical protein J1N35_037559 [Gossypium stocksii]|uniref:Uncharacterized protein n=1 Tax=Gossypium stocksii TaxID=47602 RepID=A0A9D3ZM01_9ROSI|nr:hypothetical protein J1N35_037559 [Gossypium stocksii]